MTEEQPKKKFVRFHKTKCGKNERPITWINADEICRHCDAFFRSRKMRVSEFGGFNSRK
jgi:hypothetical protein